MGDVMTDSWKITLKCVDLLPLSVAVASAMFSTFHFTRNALYNILTSYIRHSYRGFKQQVTWSFNSQVIFKSKTKSIFMQLAPFAPIQPQEDQCHWCWGIKPGSRRQYTPPELLVGWFNNFMQWLASSVVSLALFFHLWHNYFCHISRVQPIKMQWMTCRRGVISDTTGLSPRLRLHPFRSAINTFYLPVWSKCLLAVFALLSAEATSSTESLIV